MRWTIFDEQAKLAPDLEWMLQSGQADPTLLAEALVREHYLPVYRLALSLLNEGRLAEQAAQAAFAAALEKARNYPSGCGVRAWLFRLALDTCQSACRKNRLRCTLQAFLFFHRRWYCFGNSIPRGDSDVAIWRALDRMKGPLLLVTLLFYHQGWTPGEIAGLLGWRETNVGRYLSISDDSFVEALRGVGAAPVSLKGEALDRQVRQSLEARYPAPVISPGGLRQVATELVEKNVEQAPHRRRMIAFSELAWIGCVVILATILVWGSNMIIAGSTFMSKTLTAVVAERISSSTPAPLITAQATSTPDTPISTPLPPVILYYSPQPGETLYDAAVKLGVTVTELAIYNHLPAKPELEIGGSLRIPFPPIPQHLLTPTQIPIPGLKLPALSPGSSSEQVVERLLVSEHLWHTLWADTIISSKYIHRYSNSPEMTRLQVWISQPDRSLELVGPLNGEPHYFFLGYDRRLYLRWIFCGSNGSCDPAHLVLIGDTYKLLESSLVHDLLLPGRADWLKAAGHFQVVGEEVVAGRQALIVDWINPVGVREARMGLDEQNGVVLRLQEFDRMISNRFNYNDRYDIILTKIAFDVGLPEGLFDPRQEWQGGFATDYNVWYRELIALERDTRTAVESR